jgi:hypothetical protein
MIITQKKSSKLIVRGITLTLKLIANGSNVFEKNKTLLG